MAIYALTDDQLVPVSATSFVAENIHERRHIQQLLKANIAVLDDSLMVIAEEFGEWVDSSRRIDLLCLDTEANLVVVELKRTEDGGHMELQAVSQSGPPGARGSAVGHPRFPGLVGAG